MSKRQDMIEGILKLQKTKRREWTWTKKRDRQAQHILDVVEELSEYWPLTLRQIYYRLVAAGHIANTRSKYNDLSKIIKHMRIDDVLPWNVLTDRVRRVSDKRGFEDHQDFMTQEVEHFLEGYARCYVQGQENYLELWCEKDALSQVFERVAWPYCIRAVTCRGYQSITFLDDFRQRAVQALSKGQQPIILYFGDLDPSGVQMLEATAQTLEDEMDLEGVKYERVALNPAHVEGFNLPHNPDAVKLTDTRYSTYVERFGHVAVELDALHPGTLQEMAIKAIVSHLDMEHFRQQREIEQIERRKLAAIKEKVMAEIQCLTSHT